MYDDSGLQEMVDGLAARLHRSVAIDDPEIRLIVASKHFGDEDQVRVQSVLGRDVGAEIKSAVFSWGVSTFKRPQRIGPFPGFGAKARICCPIRSSGFLLGYLWLIDDNRLSDSDISDAARVAEDAGLVLHRRMLALRRQEALHGAVLTGLLWGEEDTREEAQRRAREEGLLKGQERVRSVVARILGGDETEEGSTARGTTILESVAQRTVAAQPTGSVLCMSRPSSIVVLLVGGSATRIEHADGVGRRLVDGLTDLSGRRAVAGIGMLQDPLIKARSSYEQAMLSSRAAEFFPGRGDVLRWEDLGVLGLLARLEPRDLTLATYPAPLARLVAHPNGYTLVRTAEVYLDLAGDVARTARALHVHRATVYQRLARIEQVSETSLRNGDDRLTLHLGIKLGRLTGIV